MKILFKYMIIPVCIFAILTSCSKIEKREKSLVVGVPVEMNLGPGNPVMIHRNANVWETLTILDNKLVPKPMLATSWDSDNDSRIWTFTIRTGVLFHDGTALTAGLVRENILRLFNFPELDYYSVFNHLESVEIPDDTTLVCSFKHPVADLPNKLGHYFAGLFTPASWGEDGRLAEPVACGSYFYKGGEIAQYDQLEAFPDYYKGAPYFESVEFRVIPDPVVRVMSLVRGDIDMIAHHGGVPANYRNLVSEAEGIVLDSLDIALTHYLLFNCSRTPFDDPSARDAFDRMLDRKEFVSVVLDGAGIPAYDYFADVAPRWNQNRFPVNPDTTGIDKTVRESIAARQLVFLANQKDMNLWSYRRFIDYMVDSMTRRGIQMKVQIVEGGAWQEATENGAYDLTLYPLSMPTGTPELFIRRLAFSKGMKIRTLGNITQYNSPELDALFLEALEAQSAEIQEDIYNRALDILARDKPVVPVVHARYYFAYRNGLSGVHLDPFMRPDLHSIRETVR